MAQFLDGFSKSTGSWGRARLRTAATDSGCLRTVHLVAPRFGRAHCSCRSAVKSPRSHCTCSASPATKIANLGPVYTERQRQRCDNTAMTLVTLLWLKIMKLIQIGLQPPIWSDSIVINQSSISRSVDADTQCKWALNIHHWWLTEPFWFKASFITQNFGNFRGTKGKR